MDTPWLWICYAENDADKSVRPMASAGFETGYLEKLNITYADTERGCGPTGTAIRTGRISICRNILTDPQFAPWRKEALKRGYASSIVLPLMAEGRSFGAINIYSRQPDPFSEDEVILLTELADNLAFGITSLRLRAERDRAEKALQESHEKLEQQVAERTAELVVAMEKAEKRKQIAENAFSEIKTLKDQLEAERAYLQEEIQLENNHENIIGQSDGLKYVLYKAEQIAGSDTTVLVQAEAFGYILKPFEDREMHTQIEMALYKHAAEQRLRESQARLATFAAATFEGIIEIEAGRIVDCNAQFARISGLSGNRDEGDGDRHSDRP